MKITLIVNIPEAELEQQLKKDGMTREELVQLLTPDSLLAGTSNITPGTTCTIITE